MVAVDSNADGEVNLSDKTGVWVIWSGEQGYLNGDINLDGQVDNLDKNDYWLNNQMKESQVPD